MEWTIMTSNVSEQCLVVASVSSEVEPMTRTNYTPSTPQRLSYTIQHITDDHGNGIHTGNGTNTESIVEMGITSIPMGFPLGMGISWEWDKH